MSRAVEIQYGEYKIGDGEYAEFTGTVSFDMDLERGTLDFEFLISAEDGDASFNPEQEFRKAEEAFRKRNEDFSFTWSGGQDGIEWKPSEGTAALVETSAHKIGQVPDSPNSAIFRVTVYVELPADVQDRAGERPWTISLQRNEDGVRTLTLRGEYTRHGGGEEGEEGSENVGSLEAYGAGIDDLIEQVFDRIPQPDVHLWAEQPVMLTTDDEDSVTQYEHQWVEVTKKATLTYGAHGTTPGLTVGDAEYPIIGNLSFLNVYDEIVVRAEVFVPADTGAELASKAATLKSTFRRPRGALTVTYDGETVFSGTQEAGTIIDARPSIERTGNPSYGGTKAATFMIEVRAALPADNVGNNGRRGSNVVEDYDASRRRLLTVHGTYTAFGAHATGTAAYLAAIEGYLGTLLSSRGGVDRWDITNEHLDRFETDKELDFHVELRERLVDRAAPGVIDQQLNITLTEPGLQDSPDHLGRGSTVGSVQRPMTVRGVLAANIDAEVHDDREAFEQTVHALYGYIYAEIERRLGEATVAADGTRTTDQIAVTGANREENVDGWSVVAVIECEVQSRTPWRRYQYSVAITSSTGVVVEPAWGGGPLDVYPYQGLGEVISTVREVGEHTGNPSNRPALEPPDVEGTSHVWPMTTETGQEPQVIGVPGEQASYTITLWNRSMTYRHGNPIDAQAPGDRPVTTQGG